MERYLARCLPIVFTIKTVLAENVHDLRLGEFWFGEVHEVAEIIGRDCQNCRRGWSRLPRLPRFPTMPRLVAEISGQN